MKLTSIGPFASIEGVNKLWANQEHLRMVWPEGLRHDMAWLCADFVLQRLTEADEEPRHGSWFALAAKRKWLNGLTTTYHLQQTLDRARSTMMPENWSEETAWNEQDQASLVEAVDTIQSTLDDETRAWMESDVAMHLGKEAISRLVWGSVQPRAPRLFHILAWTEHSMRLLTRSEAWNHYARQSWDEEETRVDIEVGSVLVQVRLWLEEELADLCNSHQQQRTRLVSNLGTKVRELKKEEDDFVRSMEDNLFEEQD